jgi:hypothetical protein
MSLCNPFYVTPYISKKIAAKPPLLSNRQMNTDWYVYDAVNYHITTGLSSTTLCRQSQSRTGNYRLQGGNIQATWYNTSFTEVP